MDRVVAERQGCTVSATFGSVRECLGYLFSCMQGPRVTARVS